MKEELYEKEELIAQLKKDVDVFQGNEPRVLQLIFSRWKFRRTGIGRFERSCSEVQKVFTKNSELGD